MDAGQQPSNAAILATLNNLNLAIAQLNKTMASTLPGISTTASSATAGTSGALPATPAGYLNITVGGAAKKVAFYNV